MRYRLWISGLTFRYHVVPYGHQASTTRSVVTEPRKGRKEDQMQVFQVTTPEAFEQQWCSGCGEQMHVGEPHHKVYWPGHSEYREPLAPALHCQRCGRVLYSDQWVYCPTCGGAVTESKS